MNTNNFRQMFLRMIAEASTAAKAGGGGGGGGGPRGIGIALGVVGAGALGIYGFTNSVITIQPGHMGIKYNRYSGLDEKETLHEGLNIIIPWFQRAIIFDVRTRPQLINAPSGSKDLQSVQISMRVLFRPDKSQLPFIYRRLGQDFDERVLPSVVNEVTKAVVAQYNASELLTKRELVSTQIREMLEKRLTDFHILLDDVSITHLAFSKEYTGAVESKQVAQQEAERGKYVVEKAIQEKQSIIVKARGEAESAVLIGTAIKNNPAFVQLRKIEAAREIANTVANSQNKIYINADTLLLNSLGDSQKDPVQSKGKGWY